jgi:hypothetical protein
MSTLYESYITGDDFAYEIGYSSYLSDWELSAQTFTPSANHTITSVKLKLYRVGFPGDLTIYIWQTDGNGHPTGSPLVVGSYNGNSLTTNTAGAWYEITLGAGSNLSSGTKYAIGAAVWGGAPDNFVLWRCDITSPTYSGGNFETGVGSSPTWYTQSGVDNMFEEWGNAPPVYEVSCTDGVKVGDTPVTKKTSYPIATDGVKLSEVLSVIKVMSPLVTEGVKIGDVAAVLRTVPLILTDGVKLSDVTETLITAVRIAFHSAVSQRRYKAADFATFTFPDPAGTGFTSANDGYYLLAGWGGEPVAQLTTYPSLTDGMKLGDSPVTIKIFSVALTDGVKIGDTPLAQKIVSLINIDGIKLSDTSSTQKQTFPTALDGVKLSDQTLANRAFDILVADGFILSDQAYTVGVAFVPPGIYLIEIHDSNGSLVAILDKVYEISLEETINSPALLTISIPSDDTKLSYITRARELWVRDVKTNTVISKTKLLRRDDVRDQS